MVAYVGDRECDSPLSRDHTPAFGGLIFAEKQTGLGALPHISMDKTSRKNTRQHEPISGLGFTFRLGLDINEKDQNKL